MNPFLTLFYIALLDQIWALLCVFVYVGTLKSAKVCCFLASIGTQPFYIELYIYFCNWLCTCYCKNVIWVDDETDQMCLEAGCYCCGVILLLQSAFNIGLGSRCIRVSVQRVDGKFCMFKLIPKIAQFISSFRLHPHEYITIEFQKISLQMWNMEHETMKQRKVGIRSLYLLTSFNVSVGEFVLCINCRKWGKDKEWSCHCINLNTNNPWSYSFQ